MQRAYRQWALHSGLGKLTHAVAGADTNRRVRRASSFPRLGHYRCISFELLQWFVDEILSLQCRADSRLCLNYAIGLRNRLRDQGIGDTELPTINKQWLFRWRREHGIGVRAATTKFKASFRKAVCRVGTMLGNIFRLRAFGGSVWTKNRHGSTTLATKGYMPKREPAR